MSLTQQQRLNIWTIARHVWNVEPKAFDMGCYRANGVRQMAGDAPGICGTAGCFIGYGPALADVLPSLRPIEDDCWEDYGYRIIGKVPDIWNWIADQFWQSKDNSPRGAAKRALWYLLNGLPINHFRQRIQLSHPLCYADWEPTETDWQAALATCQPEPAA